MNENIISKAKEFLYSYVKDKKFDYKTIHPWRNNWEFVILHSLRVEGYVRKILNKENHSLSSDEVLTVRLAAILHDIGRIHQRENHALLSKDIIASWIRGNQIMNVESKEYKKLLFLVERHSDKKSKENDYSLKVLRDADTLDEIGVLSIFMASSWIDRSNPLFFNMLLDRVENFEISFCDKKLEMLSTESAKSILTEKQKFIELFCHQLEDELFGTELFGQVNIEEYFENMTK
ncbi:HD domain-containing protein [Sporosalibacterium faouarense]|uniref:HD domain-containing protein n=1 Tax=Sporosalibacterium faouarense TaxID=516123 RepID=UPI00192CBAAD|nr:HD domain-containing protein [Sporosalibacterium faouarense]